MRRLPTFPKWVLILSGTGAAVGLTVLTKGGEHAGYAELKDERLEGKTVILTGANGGLGKATATELAKRGSRLIMACRDVTKCEEVRKEIMEMTDNHNIHCKHLDLSSMASVHKFAEEVNRDERRLDILINNAGIMAPPETITEDGFELQLSVNHLGPFLLTHLLLDKLKLSAPSRIIDISSASHIRGRVNFKDFNGLEEYDAKQSYYNTKLAHLFTSRILATELAPFNVSLFNVNPGVTQSAIGRHMNSNSMFSKPLWWFVMQRPQKGAQTTLYCALKPDLHELTGGYFEDCRLSEASDVILDDVRAKRTWLTTLLWTKLS